MTDAFVDASEAFRARYYQEAMDAQSNNDGLTQPFARRPSVTHEKGSGSMVRHSSIVLLLGFGGLLALMAYADWNTMRSLGQMQEQSARIQKDFVSRSRLLNQIRSDLYISGTHVRDYLLESDVLKAKTYRSELDQVHQDMGTAMQAYGRLPSSSEAAPLNRLRTQLSDYWQMLDPAMSWMPEERHRRGYRFLRDEVFPRRVAMLGIADEIASMNENQLNQIGKRMKILFSQIHTGMTATLMVTLIAGALLAAFSIFRILQVEKQAMARHDETAQARRELKDLSASLVHSQETERRAIARELHDEVGQSMSALLIGLSNLYATIPDTARGPLMPQIHALREIAETTVRTVRNISLLLRPSMLDDLGLVPALRWQAREIASRSGVRVDVAADDSCDELPEEHKTCIYRVVQEGLNNASRHAKAQAVRIHVRRDEASLFLTIQDDGCGFDTKERGLGLLGMQERVANLGGTFTVESEYTRGTLLAASLPLSKGDR